MKLKFSSMSAPDIILLITVFATALITGLWYAYSCSVNGGLGKLPDKEYLSAMQSINRVILNPAFFATFMGTLILLPLSAWLSYRHDSTRFIFLLSASVVYAIGVFGVTMVGNVPLNNALDSFRIDTASAQNIISQRTAFEKPWNRLHTIRTVASCIAFLLVVLACMSNSGNQEK